MTVEILKDSTVVIIGPPATGKTALAQRIFEENPTKSKIVIPFPKTLMDVCVQQTRCADQDTGESRKGIDSLMSEHYKYTRSVISAKKSKTFTICDGCYIDPENLTSFFYRMRMMKVFAPITLIKLMTSREQQLKNIKANLANVPNYPAPTYEELDQQNELFKGVVEKEFTAEISWVKREYLLLTTDNIDLKFL